MPVRPSRMPGVGSFPLALTFNRSLPQTGRTPFAGLDAPGVLAISSILLDLWVGGAGSGMVDGSTAFLASFDIDHASIWASQGALVR